MKNKGFSIAEAMITLLIVSVVLAAMAPMMTKKSKPTTITEKWVDAKTAGNITRPTGRVGIGIPENEDPKAKLHIKNNDDKDILLMLNSKNDSNDVRIGMNNQKRDTNYKIDLLTYYGLVELSPTNNYPHPFVVRHYDKTYDTTKIETWGGDKQAVEVTDNVAMYVTSSGAIRLNYKENDDINLEGPLGVYVNDGRRFWIRENGQTTIYHSRKDKGENGEDSDMVFVVKTCANNCGVEDYKDWGTNKLKTLELSQLDSQDGHANLFTVDKNGKVFAAGGIEDIDGTISSADIGNLKRELNTTKELVAVLKEQNELLSQKIAVLEKNINHPVNNFNRIVQEEKNNLISNFFGLK